MRRVHELLYANACEQQLGYLSGLYGKLWQRQFPELAYAKDLQCGINWVYGFRVAGVREPLQLLKKGRTEFYLYFTAKIVVVFKPQEHAQAYYVQHLKEVSVAAGSGHSTLVASGEFGKDPTVHLWDCETVRTYGIITTPFQAGVQMLKFIASDNLLVACGGWQSSLPIIAYSVKNLNQIWSTFEPGSVIDLITIGNYGRQPQRQSFGQWKAWQDRSQAQAGNVLLERAWECFATYDGGQVRVYVPGETGFAPRSV